MIATIPVPVHPWPLSDARLAVLKAAKASLGLPYLIEPVESVPGSPGRVLCFGERPAWMTARAPIRPANVNNVDSVAAALRFALEAHNDPRFDEADWLSEVMGCEVRLVGVEPHEAKVAFA